MWRKILALFIVIALAIGIYMLVHKEKGPSDHLILYGNVDIRQVDLSFRVTGQVNALFFEEGDPVKQGTLLATLDKRPYAQRVVEAEGNIQAIRASLQNAEKNLQRRQELISDGSISKEDLDNAKTNKERQIASLMQAEAALEIATSNLEFTEIYAPSDGTILTRVREVGSVVNAAEPIYTLALMSPLWIRAYCNERDLGLIYPGMEAQIFTDTPGDKVHIGKVGFISPIAEFTPKAVETTQLRTDLVYRLRIYVDNPQRTLRQGMPVTVKLNTKL